LAGSHFDLHKGSKVSEGMNSKGLADFAILV